MIEDISNQVFKDVRVLCVTNERKGRHVVWCCQCQLCKSILNMTTNELRHGRSRPCQCKKKAKDLSGERFGSFLVLRRLEINSSRNKPLWECLCDCTAIENKELRSLKEAINNTYCNCQNYSDLPGKVFGHFLVLDYTEIRGKITCLCDCGKTVVLPAGTVVRGLRKSCGECVFRFSNTSHGLSNTKLYRVYIAMLDRCYRETVVGFHRYGGRGIKVCDEWLFPNKSEAFVRFYFWSMTNGYEEGLQIDRYPNRDGNYNPQNCRWVTPLVNNNNKDSILIFNFDGEDMSIRDAIIKYESDLDYTIVYGRIKKGWSGIDAVTKPLYYKLT